MGLVFSISNFFINKTYQANNWSAKKIPSCANSALVKPTAYQKRESVILFLFLKLLTIIYDLRAVIANPKSDLFMVSTF